MSREETERWLAEFQARFGQVVRQPLDRSGRQLRARLEHYPEQTIQDVTAGPHTSARERIAVYHRQYWFRLFGVLQQEFRLTARLVGMWSFNGLASRFLETHAPRHYDIQRVADGFAASLRDELGGHDMVQTPQGARPAQAVLEASAIDDAFRKVLAAPNQVPFVFTAQHAAMLPLARLKPAPTWTVVHESWPLVELRKELASDEGELALPLPARHAVPQHWLIYTSGQGYGARPLPRVRSLLLDALCQRPVGEALAYVEREASPEEREVLLAQAQAWLAESVQQGCWSGLEVDEKGTP